MSLLFIVLIIFQVIVLYGVTLQRKELEFYKAKTKELELKMAVIVDAASEITPLESLTLVESLQSLESPESVMRPARLAALVVQTCQQYK